MPTASGGRDGRRLALSRLEGALIVAILLALLGLLLWALPLPSTASGATAHRPLFAQPVHRGSRGKQVLAFKWIAAGHAPSVYGKTVRVFHGPMTNECGKRCVRAMLALRWQLGEPIVATKQCPYKTGRQKTFGRFLYLVVTGKQPRPLCWFGRASARLARLHAIRKQRASQASACAQRIVGVARHEWSLGVHEEPDGSNYGFAGRPSGRIIVYQSVTGAYHAAWCASFVQYVFRTAGVGTIADRSAGVFYIVGWAHRQGWLRARPAVGSEVAYLAHAGHTGIVVAVSRTTFTTIEGNYSNSVKLVTHPIGFERTVFIYPPCLTVTARRPH